MKTSTYLISLIFSCCCLLLSFNTAQAQQDRNEQHKIVIIKKYIDEDGNETIEKIVSDDPNDPRLKEIAEIDVEEIDGEMEKRIRIQVNGDEPVLLEDIDIDMDMDVDVDELKRVIRIERTGADGEPFRFEWQGEGELPADIGKRLDSMDFNFDFDFDQDFDFNFNFDCDSFPAKVKSAFKSDRPFLGVVMTEERIADETAAGNSNRGVRIQEVVGGSAAEAAGLKDGDIIFAIDGQMVENIDDVTDRIQNRKAGDQLSVNYLRDGVQHQTNATLKTKQRMNRQAYAFMRGDRKNRFHRKTGDDFPCVFIGVYTNSAQSGNGEQRGARVLSVIDKTPASESGLIKGDRIIALNGVSVADHKQLVTERDKYQPGDQVTLRLIRNEKEIEVDITFRECEKETEKEEIEEESVPQNLFVPETPSLELENFSAFPNPAEGQVTVRFESQPGPISVQLFDAAGKEVYNDQLNNFDGIYNQRLELIGKGVFLLRIQQGERSFTEKIVNNPVLRP